MKQSNGDACFSPGFMTSLTKQGDWWVQLPGARASGDEVLYRFKKGLVDNALNRVGEKGRE